MGRIARVGTDTVINYTLLETTDYNEDDPAATTSPWDNTEAMDQLFDQPSPIAVIDAQGALVTFVRFPDRFLGAMVKVAANYDTSTGENPALEMWTHDSETDVWTRRRRVLFANVFTGAPTGRRKIYDFTLFPSLTNVDQVWLTMDPGSEGSPTLDWYSLQLFGQCETAQRNDGGGGSDPCDDPDDPFYPGDDICGKVFSNPNPEQCEEPDYCNEASIQSYRECLRAKIPQFLPIYDVWLDANRTLIRDFCAGTGPFPPTPAPSPPPTNLLPPLDLCDDASVAAFRAAVAGDAEHLAAFDAYIDSLTASGFFDVACADDDPPEQYVDPETGLPAEDPDAGGPSPFGSGPGGVPEFPRPDAPDDDDGTPTGANVDELTKRFILTWSGNDTDEAVTLANSLIAPLPAPTDDQERETLTGNYGPDLGVSTEGVQFTPAPYGITINLSKIPFTVRVGVRCQVFRLRGSDDLRFSIDDTGISERAAVGDCPAGPDWMEVLGAGMELAGNTLIGNDYREYAFTGPAFRNNTTIALTVPRVDPAQNDGITCTPGYEPRGRLGFQRGGCLDGFTVIEKDRWLHDVSTEDYDTSGIFDYIHVRPYCIVLDVQLFAITAQGVQRILGLGQADIELSFPADAQPIEDCS